MERPTRKGKDTEAKLQQQYKSLQEKWYSIKQSKLRTLRRSLTDSRTIDRGLYFLDNSPRKLMSLLQHRRSPSGGAWKVRNNDLAVVEILRERKAAIKSGKIKGRRLFDAAEGANEVNSGGIQEIICSYNWDGLVQEISEVRSVCSYDSDDEKENIVESKEEMSRPVYCSSASSLSSTSSSSSAYICDECIEKEILMIEGEKAVAAEVKGSEEEKKRGENGVKGWLAVGLIVIYTIGIISMRSFTIDNYRDGNMVILVPT
ncbi:uncharacterized protein LOC125369803 [Ricinus communis]|uniref:Uncharacterized protein n=1 Tax=Ricinus communis TaxID=3988 RepID=B9RAD0_RICCO|nr:uncharacterized protein LOC125369803 [Ricinus communis]EEF51757.1 conserved hypothetical protein [Ricinus communis]